jgi:glycosyltransferase involved in cell wall biosynthesis
MRVLYLQQQPCIRTLKYAAGLRAVSADVTLGFAYRGKTLSAFYGSGDELFDRWWPLGADMATGLRRVFEEFSPDVIHSHNLPDELTVLALEEADDVPVIHDVHDFSSLRSTPYEDGFPEPADPAALERRAVEGSDALVTVSDELFAEVEARYAAPKRVRVFANYVLAAMLPPLRPDTGGSDGGSPRIVYQGTLSTNGGHYDLRDIFGALVRAGATVDVYPSREVAEYHTLAAATPGLTVHATLDPRALLAELAAYDYGWAGFNTSVNAPHLDTVLPNKAFEYVGCGLPVLTLGHRALARFVTEEGVGLSLPSPEAVADGLGGVDARALRRGVAAARHRFTVEGRIGMIVELYEEVAGGRA